MKKTIDEDVRFRIMRALEENPEMSQRELSKSVGISLGLVNYCLRGLADKGLVKVRNFRASGTKLRYAYVLTPQGLATKAAMTRHFLQRRVTEYEALKHEIETLQREAGLAPEAPADPCAKIAPETDR